MARNGVQFQNGVSEPRFERLYGTEEQCRAAVGASRWPDGFVCPPCGGTRHCVVKTRGLYRLPRADLADRRDDPYPFNVPLFHSHPSTRLPAHIPVGTQVSPCTPRTDPSMRN